MHYTKNMKNEAVIRMLTLEPCILTTDEYEALQREVRGRVFTQSDEVGDRILFKLLNEYYGRYIEAWEQNHGESHPTRNQKSA